MIRSSPACCIKTSNGLGKVGLDLKKKNWAIFWIVVAVIVVLGAPALILANFSSMTSRMERNSVVSVSTGNVDASQPLNPAGTAVIVAGKDRLCRSLQSHLNRAMQNDTKFGQIEQPGELPAPAGTPLLVVEVDTQEIFWTPFYARAKVEVTASYASDGDVAFRMKKPVEFTQSGDAFALKSSGSYSFFDESWGLITSPGYKDYLAKEISRQIVNDLRHQIP